ncbi:hypothetical protein AADZ90_006800 [Aestuariibius sp. 2305UL40-4]|uniref:hypothetical protein n=1 Tax=Aestuariibius violaceus TaxID=3234132 RepID=UPI00345E7693
MRITGLELPFKLSLITGAVWVAFAIKMFVFPTTTAEPSLINCFSYIGPIEASVMFIGALGISGAAAVFSFFRSRLVIPLIEAMGLWTVTYLILVVASSSPHAISVAGLAQSIAGIGFLALLWLLFVRTTLLEHIRQG